MFSCEFCVVFKNTFFHRTPPVVASVSLFSVWYWKDWNRFFSNTPCISFTIDEPWDPRQIYLFVNKNNLIDYFSFYVVFKKLVMTLELSMFWSTLFIWIFREISPFPWLNRVAWRPAGRLQLYQKMSVKKHLFYMYFIFIFELMFLS